MTVREMLSQNLAYFRDKAGYTQKTAAEALGTKPTTISSWERGISQPSADMLVKIAFTYKASLSDLCGADYNVEFTADEKDLIYAYRNLDEIGKITTRRILGMREKKDPDVQESVS